MEQQTSPKGIKKQFFWHCVPGNNQKNIEALHSVLQVVGYVVNANNNPTGYNY